MSAMARNTTTISAAVSFEEIDQLDEMAGAEECTRNAFIRKLVADAWVKHQRRKSRS